MSRVFANPNQLEEWVEAAEGIQDRFGIEKALGYLIGEKFYNLVSTLHSARKIMRTIDEERKKSDFSPVRVTKYKDRELVTNLDEMCGQEKEIILEAEGLLVKFVFLVSQAFPAHEIRKYFESYPSLGVHGHIPTMEQFEFMVSRGAIEHSIETETEDALIFGDMMKYFGINA
jgi:hypothetical protein